MSMIQTRNQSALGTTFLDARYLMLDCTNDPLTAGLEIQAATAGEPVLTLLTTDDNITNPYLDLNNSGTPMPYIMEKDGTRFLHLYGTRNLFLGVGAGNFTLTGADNAGVGGNTGAVLTSGYQNVLAGYNAGAALTIGSRNVVLGAYAGQSMTTAWGNVFIGRRAGRDNVGGLANIYIGMDVGLTATGTNNTVIGNTAGANLGATSDAVFYGSGSGFSNTIGTANTNIGSSAGGFCTIGIWNTNLGRWAGRNNISGHYNTCVGGEAGRYSTSSNNTLLGRYAGFRQVAGASNTCVGWMAALYNVTGDNNVIIGREAGKGVLTNSYSNNVFVGSQAGLVITTGSSNVLLGYLAGSQLVAQSNRLVIANTNTLTPLVYGEFDTWRLGFGNQYSVDKYGQLTHASGQFAAAGDAQDSRYVCRLAQASHAINTWYPLFPDGGTTPERLTIAAETGWTIHVIIIGITAAAAQQWGYEIIGLLERDGAGNTTLAGQTPRVIFESDANYDAQLAADDANEALEVQVRRTGGVDYDVRWTASVRVVETTHPA